MAIKTHALRSEIALTASPHQSVERRRKCRRRADRHNGQQRRQHLKLTARQESAQNIIAGPATHVMLFGGSRSGKTFLHVRNVIMRTQGAGITTCNPAVSIQPRQGVHCSRHLPKGHRALLPRCKASDALRTATQNCPTARRYGSLALTTKSVQRRFSGRNTQRFTLTSAARFRMDQSEWRSHGSRSGFIKSLTV